MKTFALCLVLSFALLPSAFPQGSLTPPGAPTPTMKTLDQVQPRTPISSLPFTISTAGSYYLTGNLTGASGQSGITVNTNDVSIDLNGFNLTGVPSSVHGIAVSASVRNLSVTHGAVVGWAGNGIAAGSATSSEFDGVRLLNNTGDGLVLGSSSVAYRCIASGNGSNGVHATGNSNRIENNSLIANTSNGLKVDGTANLIIGNNASGNSGTDYSIVSGNNYGQILPSPGAGFSGTAWANFASGCSSGLTLCGSTCVNTQTDPGNCGTCGDVCPVSQVCSNGACTTVCPTGQTNCAGTCTNLNTDNANCGACGTVCAAGNVCSGGTCALSCQAGETNCGGACVNRQTDRNNCGACGTVCAAGQICSGGSCALSCQSGETNCGGTCVITSSDRNNCGACGTVCAAGQICSSGSCTISCQSGLTNCGGTCTNTSSDDNNCGGCGTVCAAGKRCSSGTCTLTCQPGLTNCSGVCTNTSFDPGNCGSCGHVCASGHSCSAGACQ